VPLLKTNLVQRGHGDRGIGVNMNDEELYTMIFKRRSIRKFDMTPLSEQRLQQIMRFADSVKPLIPNIRFEYSFLTQNDVKNLLPIKAPHYISIYSENKDEYLMNTGFILQQIDLYLSANNIGSCWLGMAKPTKDIPLTRNGMEFVIMLAFGDTKEELHRNSVLQFKRNSISEITSIKDSEELLEPVRLAPSASNSQPWFFSGDLNKIVVSRRKLGIIKAALYKNMNEIDIGIALCHLNLSIKHKGKSLVYDFTKSDVPSGYEFKVNTNIGVKN
jgi:nitroreductase